LLESARKQIEESTQDEPPGLTPYVDALAAIVPAEVLGLHALAISLLTPTSVRDSGAVLTTVINPSDRLFLIFVFIVCFFLSMGIYAFGHKRATTKKFDGRDFLRMLVPAFAFVAWTMAQKTTAFDAIYPSMPENFRFFIGAVGAIILGGLAGISSNKEDKRDPSSSTGRVA
jgi:hypothetical protein